MANRLAPVDIRVADDGTVWHVGDPAAWGKGAHENVDPRESMRRLEADEIRFIGPDYVKGSHLTFEARLVALTDAERVVIEKALLWLADESPDDDEQTLFTLAERIKVQD